jgi:aminodeoxyfutalosine synthase
VQAFTAVEIDYFSQITGLPLDETIRQLKEAGLGSLPGGGAEIFAPAVRERICPEKISGDRWLEVMEAVHRAGLRSNATMLYGHVESLEDRVDHMRRLRELQDRTGGFQAFIPLAFHPKNTEIADRGFTTGVDDLKALAVGRLYLDNFPHIKSFWIMVGRKLAQVSLRFGVDDIDGTVVEEKITHAAGAQAGQEMTVAELVTMIRQAGRIPVERDTLYNTVREWPAGAAE